MARSSGSGLGILNFLVGATDAGAASRKLKPRYTLTERVYALVSITVYARPLALSHSRLPH